MMLEPLGEVGANFSLQLSSRTQFTKINNKKVIAENQCEKHKKSSLSTAQQRMEKTQNPQTMGVTINNESTTTERPPYSDSATPNKIVTRAENYF